MPLEPAPERLTWDATYNGRPLSPREYDASMVLLRDIQAHGGLPAGRLGLGSDVAHVAAVAVSQSGLIKDSGMDPKSPDMTWNVVRLTPLGEVYLRQRSSWKPTPGRLE